MNIIKKIRVISWIMFGLYFAVNVGLASHITVKELAGQNQDLPKEKYLKLMNEHQNHLLTKMRDHMIPIWNYNKIIYSFFILVIVALSVICFIDTKEKT